MTIDAPAPRTRRRHARAQPRSGTVLVAALAGHVGLALVLRVSTIAATAYAIVAIVAALVIVLRAKDVERVAMAVGYVVATEVLWRMTNAHFFFEGDKYAMVALLVIAGIRFRPGWRTAVIPAVYLAAFVPALVLGARHFGGVVAAREPLSFNAAGPVALGIAVWSFCRTRTSLEAFRSVLWAAVLPLTSIATITLTNTIVARSITFDLNANLTTSGGFSPNEVCSALGFGVLACLLLAVTERNLRLRVLEIALSIWLLGEAILTLSRGGVLNIGIAVLLALVMVAGRARSGVRVVLVGGVIAIATISLLLPLLNGITGGHLLDRYQYTSSSRRDLIVEDDLHLFREHPLLGVGIGVSPETRPPKIKNQEAHTEFTRALAEQGALGVVALVALLAMVVGAFRRAHRGPPRALVAAFVGWSFTEMTHSATRLALTSFALGLAVLAAGMSADEGSSPSPRPVKAHDRA